MYYSLINVGGSLWEFFRVITMKTFNWQFVESAKVEIIFAGQCTRLVLLENCHTSKVLTIFENIWIILDCAAMPINRLYTNPLDSTKCDKKAVASQPKIFRMSTNESPASGGQEVFVLVEEAVKSESQL